MNKYILKTIFNLNDYESRCLEVILNKKKCFSKELASAVPHSRIYDICENLRKKGLIIIHDKVNKTENKKFTPMIFEAIEFDKMVKNTKKLIMVKAREGVIAFEQTIKKLK